MRCPVRRHQLKHMAQNPCTVHQYTLWGIKSAVNVNITLSGAGFKTPDLTVLLVECAVHLQCKIYCCLCVKETRLFSEMCCTYLAQKHSVHRLNTCSIQQAKSNEIPLRVAQSMRSIYWVKFRKSIHHGWSPVLLLIPAMVAAFRWVAAKCKNTRALCGIGARESPG